MANDDMGTLTVTFQGHQYGIQMGDFSAKDEMDFERVTGGRSLMACFTEGKFDSVAVAGMLWLVKRRYEKSLNFDKLAARFKWNDMQSIEFSGGPEEDEDEETPEEEDPTPETYGVV